jgi:hypothetical protein
MTFSAIRPYPYPSDIISSFIYLESLNYYNYTNGSFPGNTKIKGIIYELSLYDYF